MLPHAHAPAARRVGNTDYAVDYAIHNQLIVDSIFMVPPSHNACHPCIIRGADRGHVTVGYMPFCQHAELACDSCIGIMRREHG